MAPTTVSFLAVIVLFGAGSLASLLALRRTSGRLSRFLLAWLGITAAWTALDALWGLARLAEEPGTIYGANVRVPAVACVVGLVAWAGMRFFGSRQSPSS